LSILAENTQGGDITADYVNDSVEASFRFANLKHFSGKGEKDALPQTLACNTEPSRH
jgi:hypothetical protein